MKKLTIVNTENEEKLSLQVTDEILLKLKENGAFLLENDEEIIMSTASFNFWCMVYGHAWYENVCTRCGATR